MNLFPTLSAPQALVFDLTGKCNLHCRYCCFFHSDSESHLPDLPTAAWLALLKEAGDAHVLRVSLRGGEPLTRPDFREIVQGIVDNRMRFILQTNATLLTPDMADFIQATGRCDRCSVSIDGTEEVHDAVRGKGTWQAAVRGARLLLERGLPVKVVATVHHQNFDRLEETAKHLLDELEFPSFSFSFATELLNTPPDLSLTPAEFYEGIRRVLALRKRYSAQQLPKRGPLGLLAFWSDLYKAQQTGRLPKRSAFGHCNAVFSAMAVRSDGAYIPCTHLSDNVLGYAGRDTLLDVWQKSKRMQEIRAYAATEYPAKCNDCPYQKGCPTNCPGHPHAAEQGFGCLQEYLAGGGELDV